MHFSGVEYHGGIVTDDQGRTYDLDKKSFSWKNFYLKNHRKYYKEIAENILQNNTISRRGVEKEIFQHKYGQDNIERIIQTIYLKRNGMGMFPNYVKIFEERDNRIFVNRNLYPWDKKEFVFNNLECLGLEKICKFDRFEKEESCGFRYNTETYKYNMCKIRTRVRKNNTWVYFVEYRYSVNGCRWEKKKPRQALIRAAIEEQLELLNLEEENPSESGFLLTSELVTVQPMSIDVGNLCVFYSNTEKRPLTSYSEEENCENG